MELEPLCFLTYGILNVGYVYFLVLRPIKENAMRFKLTLQILPDTLGRELPINYQYELSAAIYRILSCSDKDYSLWLHENGFIAGGKRFKLFTFSNLIVSQYSIHKERQRLIIKSDTVEWYISFLPEKSTQQFIEGVFRQQSFHIADKISGVEFLVREVQVMPPLDYLKEMYFQTLSPVCVSKRRDDGKSDYLSPTDSSYVSGLVTGLLARYEAYYGKEYEGEVCCDFQVLNEPKPVLIKIKEGTPQQTFVKGFRYNFKVNLPEVLMSIGYESGWGEKGAIGFGMIARNDCF